VVKLCFRGLPWLRRSRSRDRRGPARWRAPPALTIGARASALAQCVHETMNSECESHYRAGGRDRHAVEGNCVVARRGGEQLETEGWSQTKVNSIRHVQRVSLLGKGEACRESDEPVLVRGLPILETGRCRCGWSGNVWKGAGDKWRDRREWLTGAGVRGSIVAKKPGNAGGAKGSRKVNAR